VVDVERESFSRAARPTWRTTSRPLGGEAVLLSVVGEDASGEQLRSALARAGVRAESIVADPERRTTVKTRILAHQQQVVRADEEDTEPVRGPALRRLHAALERLVPEVDAIVVSDYGKGVVHPDTIQPAISLARANRITVSVDPKQDHFSSYQSATLLTPNQLEAGQAFGRRITDEETLAEAGWGLRERYDLECLVITRGAGGMSLFEREGRYTHLPTVAREVFDVTGAGDTVVAVMALALAAGGFRQRGEPRQPRRRPSFATRAPRSSRRGAQRRSRPRKATDRGRVLDADQARAIADLHQHDKVVVFTNGVRHPHAGHVTSSMPPGRCPVRGLNSDARPGGLAGERRPVLPETTARVLCGSRWWTPGPIEEDTPEAPPPPPF
jgi:D-beta-D-heptose 7-phosphate kinase/D-beta-D-heptose 1-phosphate adenosyltransferase